MSSYINTDDLESLASFKKSMLVDLIAYINSLNEIEEMERTDKYFNFYYSGIYFYAYIGEEFEDIDGYDYFPEGWIGLTGYTKIRKKIYTKFTMVDYFDMFPDGEEELINIQWCAARVYNVLLSATHGDLYIEENKKHPKIIFKEKLGYKLYFRKRTFDYIKRLPSLEDTLSKYDFKQIKLTS